MAGKLKDLSSLDEFDPAKYLDTPEAQQAYIDEAVATGDPAFITESIGVVAKAKGMTQIAANTGLARESLYRALGSNGNPNLKTLLAVLKELNISLTLNAKSA